MRPITGGVWLPCTKRRTNYAQTLCMSYQLISNSAGILQFRATSTLLAEVNCMQVCCGTRVSRRAVMCVVPYTLDDRLPDTHGTLNVTCGVFIRGCFGRALIHASVAAAYRVGLARSYLRIRESAARVRWPRCRSINASHESSR